MSLEKILSIAGKPGLYELKAQTRTGLLAESLTDGKKVSVSARHNVSLLSEIAIYTLSEEMPLAKVFQKISEKENGGNFRSEHALNFISCLFLLSGALLFLVHIDLYGHFYRYPSQVSCYMLVVFQFRTRR